MAFGSSAIFNLVNDYRITLQIWKSCILILRSLFGLSTIVRMDCPRLYTVRFFRSSICSNTMKSSSQSAKQRTVMMILSTLILCKLWLPTRATVATATTKAIDDDDILVCRKRMDRDVTVRYGWRISLCDDAVGVGREGTSMMLLRVTVPRLSKVVEWWFIKTDQNTQGRIRFCAFILDFDENKF